MVRRNGVLAVMLIVGLTLPACGSEPALDVQAIETQTAAKIFATLTASVPTPEPAATSEAAVDAIKSLRRMVSATEVGITYQEYGSRLIDLKGDVDEALAQLPDGELKTELSLAMEAYSDALRAWSYLIEHSRMFTDWEPGASLKTKYNIPEIVPAAEDTGSHAP